MGRVARRVPASTKAIASQPKPRGRPPRASKPPLPETAAAAATTSLTHCEYSADGERLTFHLRSRESYTITPAHSSPEHFWGTIYSAEWRHPAYPKMCNCAIKASDFQLSQSKTNDARAEYRRPRNDFDREVRAFQSTNHHNVLQMYGFWEWDDRGYIALKKMKGSLGDVLYERAYQDIVRALRLDETILAELARQVGFFFLKLWLTRKILTGLDHLHSKNIVYRDLKPDNLLISYRPRMKLADFGNVHFLPTNNSLIRGLEGTVSYMSPEMRMGHYYNTKTDIWSFGITMLNVIFDNNTTFPNFELAGPWAARKFAGEQFYLSTELKTFIQTLFLKSADRPSAKELLNVLPIPC